MNKLEWRVEIAPVTEEVVLFKNAKPAVPIKAPKEREVPLAPSPLPKERPIPQEIPQQPDPIKEPVTVPSREPVPVGS